jgi:ABC-type amino acid transport system permease subunit
MVFNTAMKNTPSAGYAKTVPEKVPFFNDPDKRSILYQIGVLLLVGLLGYYLITNTLANLEKQAIATGFGFLEKESSFEIGESLIPYSAANTYGTRTFGRGIEHLNRFVYRDRINGGVGNHHRRCAVFRPTGWYQSWPPFI